MRVKQKAGPKQRRGRPKMDGGKAIGQKIKITLWKGRGERGKIKAPAGTATISTPIKIN
jgi:hypothetical protein